MDKTRSKLTTFRRWLLKFLFPVTQWIGRTHMPFAHKLISGEDYYAIEAILKPGMIFMTKTLGELSNLVNPGFWKHGAIYIGNGVVVEAVGKGVIEKNLIEFLLKKDYVAVLKPLFADQIEMELAAAKAVGFVGADYDFNFELKDKAFYCYEVLYRAYRDALVENDKEMPFKIKRTSVGIPVIVGDDFYQAKQKWESVWDNKPL